MQSPAPLAADGLKTLAVDSYETVPELFEAAVATFGGHEAIVGGTERLSYEAWWKRAGGVASALRDRGVRRGDVVAAVMPTCIDYAVVYLAAVRLGAVMTGLNPRLGPSEVAAIFDKARPAAVVCDDEAAALLPADSDVSVVARHELAAYGCRSAPERPAVDPRGPVAIVWTSGTTGRPKGAWFDHRSLRGAAHCAGDLTLPHDRRLVPIPFMHAGFMTKLWDLTASANTVVMTPKPWTAATMLHQMVSERITVAVGVPTQWSKLLSLPELAGADLSSLRVAVTSTAPAPPELVRAMRERLNCAVLVRFALTETGVGTGTRADDTAEVVFETVGRTQAGTELRLVDPDGRRVGVNEVGRIELKTPAQMRGYWAEPERTAESLTPDGFVRTGDLGRVRPDGNLVLCGRSTDMYIRGGYNVYPLEVENVLTSHPAVAAAAVIGSAAPVIGEEGVAVVMPADPAAPPSLGELRAFVAAHIADYKAPDRLILVEDLPRTPTGKTVRPALRALVDDARVNDAASSGLGSSPNAAGRHAR